jgi:hypothetical protein
LKILPGSKSGKVAIPAEFLKTDEEAAKNLTILPGSKSLAKVIEVDPAKVAAALRKAREAEAEATKRATEKPKKPTFLPGSKSAPIIIIPEGEPKPIPPVPKPPPASKPQPQTQKLLPGSKSSTLLDPTQLKPQAGKGSTPPKGTRSTSAAEGEGTH